MASGIAAIGFVLTWFIPETPLRTTVTSRHADAAEKAGDTFAMPAPESTR